MPLDRLWPVPLSAVPPRDDPCLLPVVLALTPLRPSRLRMPPRNPDARAAVGMAAGRFVSTVMGLPRGPRTRFGNPSGSWMWLTAARMSGSISLASLLSSARCCCCSCSRCRRFFSRRICFCRARSRRISFLDMRRTKMSPPSVSVAERSGDGDRDEEAECRYLWRGAERFRADGRGDEAVEEREVTGDEDLRRLRRRGGDWCTCGESAGCTSRPRSLLLLRLPLSAGGGEPS
jgi:hypothetical protein